MSSAFNLNGCFVLQRNDVSNVLCERVDLEERAGCFALFVFMVSRDG